MLAILDRRAHAGHVDAEVVVELPRRRVDEHDLAGAALNEASATLVEQITLSICAARRATDEAGVGA
jgi:hypothetical protein